MEKNIIQGYNKMEIKKITQIYNTNKQSKFVRLKSYSILKESSIYIISQIGKAKTHCRKLIWCLILVIGFVNSVYQTQKFLKVYLNNPIIVSLQDENMKRLDFPAVTVCNLNRMKAEYEYCENNDIVERGCIRKLFAAPSSGNFFGSSSGNMAISERRKTMSCSRILNETFKHDTKMKLDFFSKYSKMDRKNRQHVGHQVEEMIKHCAYNMQSCSFENFTHFQNLRYGNCYTFNSPKQNGKEPLKTSMTGYKSGLELLVYVDKEQYTSITSTIGIRISVSGVDETPNPEQHGINIEPGFETSIALTQRILKRLPAPYRDRCINYSTQSNRKNKEECLKICQQERSFKKCGCIDPTVLIMSGIKQCNLTNERDVCCLDNVQDNMAKHGSPCECPMPCFKILYEFKLSKAVWLHKKSFFINKSNHDSVRQIRKNQVFVKIFYSSLSRNIYEQIPMFEDTEIFSNLGGELGLWLGISLFALFEIIEILIAFCWRIPKLFAPRYRFAFFNKL